MLSVKPAVAPADPLLGNSLGGFHGGFASWETVEPFFTYPDPDAKPNSGSDACRYHAGFDSDSDEPDQKPPSFDQEPNQNSAKSNSAASDSGSENPRRNSAGLNSGSCDSNGNSPGSGLDELNQVASMMDDERKQRRKISNRESARRSRMRKQRHLENLRNQANRLKTQNREWANRLRFVTQYIFQVRRENDRLRTESIFLQRRLREYSRIMQLQALQQNYSSSSSSSSSTPMQGHALLYNLTLINHDQMIAPSLII